jgi:hypothetical protein
MTVECCGTDSCGRRMNLAGGREQYQSLQTQVGSEREYPRSERRRDHSCTSLGMTQSVLAQLLVVKREHYSYNKFR